MSLADFPNFSNEQTHTIRATQTRVRKMAYKKLEQKQLITRKKKTLLNQNTSNPVWSVVMLTWKLTIFSDLDRTKATVITLKPVCSQMNLCISSCQQPAHREREKVSVQTRNELLLRMQWMLWLAYCKICKFRSNWPWAKVQTSYWLNIRCQTEGLWFPEQVTRISIWQVYDHELKVPCAFISKQTKYSLH